MTDRPQLRDDFNLATELPSCRMPAQPDAVHDQTSPIKACTPRARRRLMYTCERNSRPPWRSASRTRLVPNAPAMPERIRREDREQHVKSTRDGGEVA